MSKSAIEWIESTWNPVTGCTKISSGCKNCYAERMAHRLHSMGLDKYKEGFHVAIHPTTLDDPLRWGKPRMIFVNSMSDLFHEEVDMEFIQRVFRTMNRAEQHTFQVLTKRPERLRELDSLVTWSPNIWMGTSIESVRWLFRLDILKHSQAKVKFLSLEPLLGPLGQMDLDDMDWVIAGRESGPGAHPMECAWVREIRDGCKRSHTPFFFKQWGARIKNIQVGYLMDEPGMNCLSHKRSKYSFP